MKQIENYVCTFEQAKKLKELGINQNSLFYYRKYITNFSPRIMQKSLTRSIPEKLLYSAFTSQELGELITGLYDKYDLSVDINQSFFCDRVFCWRNGDEFIEFEPTFTKEAQVRAEFLIHLLENKK